jgi:hypothetical protein
VVFNIFPRVASPAAHACNPNTLWRQEDLEVKARLGYIVKPVSKKLTKNKTRIVQLLPLIPKHFIIPKKNPEPISNHFPFFIPRTLATINLWSLCGFACFRHFI